MKKILFVDRDGTILVEPGDQQIDSLAKLVFVPGAIMSLHRLQAAGWQLVLVSNQDGLGTTAFPDADFRLVQGKMIEILSSCDINFAALLICPHRPQDRCGCRKPQLGLLPPMLIDGLDRAGSAVVGDRPTDLQFAEKLGIRGFQLTPTQGWPEVVLALTKGARTATVRRETRECRVAVTVDLDAPRPPRIATGQAFFDHMLEQVGQHGGIGLVIEAQGDFAVDDHHTVEDTAIALGEALRQALGDKQGIARYGFLLPMDESLAQCALDFSGRAHCTFDAAFTREKVGGLATEMVPHFFRSLAEAMRATLHIAVRGENHHHMIEACFKAFARTLRQAVRRDEAGGLPSTKGVL